MPNFKPNIHKVNKREFCHILPKALLSALIVASSAPAIASIYKVTAPDGNIVFTDNPQRYQNNSDVHIEPLTVSPSASTYSTSNNANRSMRSTSSSHQSSSNQSSSTARVNNRASNDSDVIDYQVQIISPQSEQVYRRPADQVEIAIEISPSLQDGDIINILLDDESIGQDKIVSIPTLDMTPGKHSLTVEIKNATGDILQGEQIAFYVIQNTVALQRHKRLVEQLNAYNELPWHTKAYLRLRQNELHQNDKPVGAQSRPSSAFTNGGSSSAF